MQSLASTCSRRSHARPIGGGELLRQPLRARWSPVSTARTAQREQQQARCAASSGQDAGQQQQQQQQPKADDLFTCRRCKRRVSAASNTSASCRYHPSLFSGGEVAKAIGFVRASADPQDQLEAVVGRKGLMRFWDCCGSEDPEAEGCRAGFHLTFDDDENARRGWR